MVLNRINSADFPDTLKEVIYEKGQYECVNNGSIYEEYDEVAFEIAEGLLVEGSILPESVVFQAEFKQGSAVYEKVGNTYYCYK